ncbi:unnamed protein product [Rotaria sordida]|uniref:Uncharacterized protein n=1 Tax=Rotaria sordida TaxID=392033 RepID=A0A814L7K7_9BILA|nr:unnamed protein product [Rotaria sordida]CAF3729922.1 unnamed protein product [Rotaria sordida]
MDLSQYGNVTWPQRRVPRVIHQTYRTYDIPAIWNRPVQSVMTMNAVTISIIASADVLASISTKAPDPLFYPHMPHPSQPQRLNLSHE